MSSDKVQNVKEISSLTFLIVSLIISAASTKTNTGGAASKSFFITQFILIMPFAIDFVCLYLTNDGHHKINIMMTIITVFLIGIISTGAFTNNVLVFTSNGTIFDILTRHFLEVYVILAIVYYIGVAYMENLS